MLANLAVVDAYLVDRSGAALLSDAAIGQKVGVRLDWTTSDLPSDIENYQVEFRVDGVPLRSDDTTLGAGFANGSYWWYRTGWYASPGTHTVQVILDIDSEVSESNELDNSISFDFTPFTASFPQKLSWPLELEPLTEVFWSNYNDVDPSDGLSDFQGRNATYDTHNAIDARLVTYAVQDQGIEVYAALDGVVTSVHDGEFDRQNAFNPSTSNSVVIDHGNGWETLYLHFRRDSIQVEVGQTVSQGDKLGLVGSSGSSTAPHIHFELRKDGLPVETYYDPNTYWNSPADYVFDNVYLVDTGITNYSPGGQHFWEGPSDSHVLAQQSGIGLYARGYYSGLEFNDLVESYWYRPNGSFYDSRSFNVNNDYSRSGWYWTNDVNLPSVPDLGTWRVDYRVNGSLLGSEFFEITPDGEPEIRVEQPNGDIVIDGRFTPFDFGSVNVGAASPTQSFTVINHGYDTLTIDSLELPIGYTLVEGLAASLQPGASDSLTVALDTTTGSYYAGTIRIGSNDTDEPIYDFAVEGIVTSGGVNNLVVGVAEFRVDEGSSMVANVRRTGSSASAVTVTLATNDSTEINLPSTVQFAPGEDYVQFFFDATSDEEFDGDQRVAIIATASGYYGARNTVEVVDDMQQIGDFTGDGLVRGADFLAWQRGMSTNPLSLSDLSDWQENFGVLSSTARSLRRSNAPVKGVQDTTDLDRPDSLAFYLVTNPNRKLEAPKLEGEGVDQTAVSTTRYAEVVSFLSPFNPQPSSINTIFHWEMEHMRGVSAKGCNLNALDRLFAELGDDGIRTIFPGL